jgi:cytochrome c-type biogenesis protein CcmH/NrfG
VRYNLALARLGRDDEYLAAMETAHRLDPRNTAILEVLASERFERQRWRDAERYARQLRGVTPDSDPARRVLGGINALREAGLIE